MVSYCQDFKPGAGGKPRDFGPMPPQWPFKKSFQTHLAAILNGTDSQLGPIRSRPAANPPPRPIYEAPTSAESPRSDFTPNKRPKLAHPLPTRPPSPAAVGASNLGSDPMSLDVPEPADPLSSRTSYVSKATQTEPNRAGPNPHFQPQHPRSRPQSLPYDPPAPPLPPQFYMRARAALPNSRAFPGKKCPLGLGRYSAMPPPANYDTGMHSVTVDLSKPQPQDELFEEGTKWHFPPPCKDWEKAVGYQRSTKAQMEAEIQQSLQAQADAEQLEEVDPRLPRNSHRTIKVPCVDEGKEIEIEMSVGGFGFKQLTNWDWAPGDGLGLKGKGRLLPVDTMDPPKIDEELIWDPNFL